MEPTPQNVGVINPYALAETILDRDIDWDKEDPHKLFPETFGQSYESLFDPKNESPLYVGLQLNRDTLEMEKSDMPTARVGAPMSQEPAEPLTDATAFRSDADTPLDGKKVADVLSDVSAGAAWADKGEFFHEAAEFFDPVQGAVGDCYLIAAMSSVAWAQTYEISHRSRATGISQEQFVDMIPFFDGAKKVIEVTEKVPVNGAGNFIYARSSEQGEVWPAVYEKAYAMAHCPQWGHTGHIEHRRWRSGCSRRATYGSVAILLLDR